MTRSRKIIFMTVKIILFFGISLSAQGEICISKLSELNKIEGAARETFGKNWRTLFPDRQLSVKVFEASDHSGSAPIKRFKVQLSDRDLIEINVAGETYSGKICSTKSAFEIRVVLLGGLIPGPIYELAGTGREGEIKVAEISSNSSGANEASFSSALKYFTFVLKDAEKGSLGTGIAKNSRSTRGAK